MYSIIAFLSTYTLIIFHGLKSGKVTCLTHALWVAEYQHKDWIFSSIPTKQLPQPGRNYWAEKTSLASTWPEKWNTPTKYNHNYSAKTALGSLFRRVKDLTLASGTKSNTHPRKRQRLNGKQCTEEIGTCFWAPVVSDWSQ